MIAEFLCFVLAWLASKHLILKFMENWCNIFGCNFKDDGSLFICSKCGLMKRKVKK